MKRREVPLVNCPKCGMDSGERKQTDDITERFLVICTTCGCRTGWYLSKSAATRAWNMGDYYGKQN